MHTQPPVNVVLVDHTKAIDPVLMTHAASALDQQVRQDLASAWSGINASVTALPGESAIRPGDWPVFLLDKLPPGMGGVHLDKNHQPYALVIAKPDDQSWTIDASHEICEMLVDPFGRRLHSSSAIAVGGAGVVDAQGTFRYLIEACDPCEANDFGYDIQGILVSDFITPHYYDTSATPGTRYSFKGNIQRPRELLKGGYISFMNSQGTWQQIVWLGTPAPVLKTLPANGSALSHREHVHAEMGRAGKDHERHKSGGVSKPVQDRVDTARAARGAAQRPLSETYTLA